MNKQPMCRKLSSSSPITLDQVLSKYWELANLRPEETKGSITGQLKALDSLCEELAFRGFLQPLLARSLGAAPAILLAAIPFGLLHYPEYGDSWRHALIIAAAGAAFGAMRQVTGSTKAAVLMHASYNAFFFLVMFADGKDLPHSW